MAGSAYFVVDGPIGSGVGSSISTGGNLVTTDSPFSEFIIGAKSDNGVAAYIYTGASSSADGIPADGSLPSISFTTTVGDDGGTAVLGGFDFNGDGVHDVAVSAPNANGGNGAVYVIFGREDLLDANLTLADMDGTSGVIINGVNGSNFGASMTAANLDGVVGDELIIGAPSAGAGSDAGQGGVVAVSIADLAGNASYTVTDFDLVGLAGGDALGASVANVGDINGDDIDDIAIGAPGVDADNSDDGAIYVIFGTGAGNPIDGADLSILSGSSFPSVTPTLGLVITGDGQTNEAGRQVSNAGDMNDDGINDLLITAPGASESYVVFGTSGGFTPADAAIDLGNLGNAGVTISGTVNGLVGIGVGDVSGDGLDDLLFTEVDEFGVGTAYLVYGGALVTDFNLADLDGTNGYTFTNIDTGGFGTEFAANSIGDVNNDGINDLALGSSSANFGDGQSLGFMGGSENLAALATVGGGSAGTIDVSAFNGFDEVDFVPTDLSVTIGGDNTGEIDLRDDETTVSGIVEITDLDDAFATFDTSDGATASAGLFGDMVVADDGDGSDETDRWTYTLNAAGLALLVEIGDGETIQDRILLTASNGSQRAINITITGEDDEAVVSLQPSPVFLPALPDGTVLTEDFASVQGTFTVEDPDQNDNPDLAGLTFEGTYGEISFSEDGTEFTYVFTEDLPELSFGQSRTEEFSETVDGIVIDFQFTIEGRDEDTTNSATGSLYNLDGDGVTVSFGAGDEGVVGTAGDDFIDTGAGNDRVDGGAGNDTITDAFGNDTVSGGSGNDNVTLLSGENTIDDTGGLVTDSNYFKGGVGRDTITGGAGNDVIDGDAASSVIGSADVLDGGAGDDVMRGGLGTDTFIFATGSGNDTIASYAAVEGGDGSDFVAVGLTRDFNVYLDTVELIGFAGITAGNVMNNVRNVDGNAVFDVGNDGIDTLTFWDVSASDLSASNFDFG